MKKMVLIGFMALGTFCAGLGTAFAAPQDMGRPGSKIWAGKELYFTYQFDKRPALGTVIVKIRVFGRDGGQRSDLDLTGNSGMPSMGSAHDSGKVKFKKNRKGDYLLPVNVVMPGEWVVEVMLKKGKAVLFTGKIKFDV